MTYKITTLSENCVYDKGLQGEHGLSLFVETPDCKILFDTGASDLFIRNARVLGIDLREADYVVLSHGHQDHTGGLSHFLALNSKAKILCKSEIFRPKYKNDQDTGGMHRLEKAIQSRLLTVEETTEPASGVFIFPQIPVIDKGDTHFDDFFIETPEGERYPDTFEDELALVLKKDKSISILSACSHRGITNIVRAVQNELPDMSLQLIMGGFHLHKAPEEKFNIIAAFLGRKLPRRLGVCHCTGIDKYALFRQQFSDRVFYNYTGRIETF